jgi:hypothetical protein
MALTDEQKHAVAAWIEEGAKPADVQARLEKEFDIRLTYMEVRFLIDDLKVMPKDPEPPTPPAEEKSEGGADAAAEAGGEADASAPGDELAPAGEGKLSVHVDKITRPGAMVSGRATFSDGKTSEWYLDQYGRLGMIPSEPGYRPPQQDLMEFQVALEKELVKLGL